MGAWGPGPFENDDALDWTDMFLNAPDGVGDGESENVGKLAYLLGPLAGIANSTDAEQDADGESDEDEGGEIDVDLAGHAIAAAEVIAAIHGKPNQELAAAIKDVKRGGVDDDEEESSTHLLARWIIDESDDHKEVKGDDILELAVTALERVRDQSELAALWDEAGGKDAKAWKNHMADLMKRLGGK